MGKLLAEIVDGCTEVKLTLQMGDEVKRKTCTLSDYVSYMTASATDTLYSIPKLPKGYVAGRFKPGQRTFSVLACLPGKITAAKYLGNDYIIPLPTLLFSFNVVNGSVIKSDCFALADDNVDADTVLYQYPFGNVSNDGHICWGGNQLPNIDDIGDVEKLISLFINSDSNSDYWTVGSHVKRFGKDQTLGKFYTYLTTKRKFPTKLLVEKCRVGDLFKEYNL